ncbi:hypothetical protein AAZX31_11G076800 [Glycine max]
MTLLLTIIWSAKGTKMGSPKSLACSSETLPEIFTMGRILVRI